MQGAGARRAPARSTNADAARANPSKDGDAESRDYRAHRQRQVRRTASAQVAKALAVLFVAWTLPVEGVQHYALSLQAVSAGGAVSSARPPRRRGGRPRRLRDERSVVERACPSHLWDQHRRV